MSHDERPSRHRALSAVRSPAPLLRVAALLTMLACPAAVAPAPQPALVSAPARPDLALPAAAAPDTAALLARVRILSGPAFAGRGNGSPEALAAADTIATWLGAAGLAPAAPGGWFQDFTLRAGPERAAISGLPARNVLGALRGTGALSGRWLVVGAHYDHLGRVEAGGAGYYPGADDNASGVAALVELARLLAAASLGDTRPRRGILFAAFEGEEDGLQGSSYLASHLPMARDSLDAMVNLDGVGRLREGRLYVGGTGTAALLPGLLAAVNARHGLSLQEGRGGWDASDHVSFNAIGVPVLFFMTGPHEQYHSPADVWTLVSARGMGEVVSFTRDVLLELEAHAGALPYVAVAEPPAARPAAGGSARKSWLGVIPDFGGDVQGVRLAGVMPGSPAAAAGLARDDVLVGFAGARVTNLVEYTQALRAKAPGDTVTVEVLRGGERLTRSVVLAARR